MSPLFSRAAADGSSKRVTSLRLPERRHTRAMGFQAMSHPRDGDATFLGYSGIFVLIRNNPDAGDCRVGSINMLKKRTQVSASRRERTFHWAPMVEVHSVKYSR